MSDGLVTFFQFKELGFSKIGDDYDEPLSMVDLLSNFKTWFEGRSSLADTLMWDEGTAGYEFRKKIYVKALEQDAHSGDFILILWRAVGTGKSVYGIPRNAALTDTSLYSSNESNDEDLIWGEPMYYWFIPSLNVFASIKFQHSISDSEGLNRTIRDFVTLRSDIREKITEHKTGTQGPYLSISFPSTAGGNLWFRIRSKQFTKLTGQEDLEQIASQITHFVKREVISAQVMHDSAWHRLCGRIPYLSSEVTSASRKVEINVEASPTGDELAEIFDDYNSRYNHVSDNWTNLGFKKEGVGGICWLNQFVVKNVLAVHGDTEQESDNSAHYTAETLFTALTFARASLLAPFANTHTHRAVVNG